ncbi:Glycosyltransferase involved in cell wall bisynthesis [Roseateles sp. YR242]|uniref:glycosyltransferase family 4 protein n=1 Tax=Roseateles sp. YR242 TaxID=1855305 RepID=UPI0008D8AE7C|nr:glycosyltransferase family 4 protein [Roseateles sp. YR242]SEK92737.1 Glycosyltransferase involved in cell wall bisynthesis [Roseateles sp. YR242]
MKILVIHQNFPGQFGHLVQAWARRPGWDVRGIGRDTSPGIPGFRRLMRYRPSRQTHPGQHPYLRQMESATLHGQAVARLLMRLKRNGFVPDAIVAHPGWGETLFAKDVFPQARLIHLCEWFYNADGADLGFDPEFPLSLDERARVRTWNALHTLNLTHCDVAISPTRWQRDRHPEIFQSKILVQHEGVDIERLGPDPAASFTLPDGTVLKAGDPVVTYVARNLEPYRGFHVFMRALEQLQRLHPTCHTVIVGGDGVSYGSRPKDAPNWKTALLRQVSLDPARTHFLGRLAHRDYLRVLQVSAAHVYLTYPFVLSWSLLEAMASGTPLVASDTAPVREVLQPAEDARLVDFFDPAAIADAVHGLLEAAERPRQRRPLADYGHAAGLAGYDAALGLDAA